MALLQPSQDSDEEGDVRAFVGAVIVAQALHELGLLRRIVQRALSK